MGGGGEAKPLLMESNTTGDNEYGSANAKGVSSLRQNSEDCEQGERRDVESSSGTMTDEYSQSVTPLQAWKTLTAALLIGLVAGSLYGFGRYSRDLKDTMGISQSVVQRFGILLDTGNYIGHPLTGWVYDRFGPRVSCVLAAMIVFVSYGSIHLGLLSAPIWMVDLGFFGVGFGSGLGYIAGLGSTTSAFLSTPHLGRAVGTVAAGYGFSSTLVGVTYQSLGLHSFFLLWAVLVAIMNIIGAFVFVPQKETTESDEPRIIEPESTQENEIMLIDQGALNNMEDRLLRQDTSDTLPLEGAEGAHEWTTWKRLDFWLLFGSFACITGCGLMIINNVSTMVQSIGGDDSLAGILVVGLSICNVFGRLLMGSLADHPKFHKLDLYRYSSLLMAVSLLISAVGGTSAICLAVTVAFAAISYGGSWVLIIGILADFYGKANFGKDYGLIAMGPAISGMVFNSLSASFYEEHADQESGVCIGSICYRNAFFMTATSATIGYLILLWLLPARPNDRGSIRFSQMLGESIA